ncbi:hypothetical protein KBY75_00740 [Cyanobium sp. T1G-Tous]|uniref:hypothetical protein n=1 Tax=Cyanobium sp. T1G-Tous TaxID=2823722 RepID=UPI0020CF8C80|nr:hypothetical protein [Cyanobium sp. T1G-Tous]MCP9802090.1 hypothetical protein [Cyanobium sp. T1G-Tous]
MTTSPHSLQQRYEAIERVYSERQWDDVARLSEELLLELPNEPADPLRQRLQLLLGHTYLYGYQDRATATGFYSRVRAATQEPVLRDIADQGLEQCASQAAQLEVAPVQASNAPSSGGQAFPFGNEPVAGGTVITSAGSAMPWMEQLGGIEAAEAQAPVPNLVVEVVNEPELIEVAQADAASAEELWFDLSEETLAGREERIAEPVGGPSPEELAELSKGLLRVVIR